MRDREPFSARNEELACAIRDAAGYARTVRTLPANIGWHLAGLADGEGCFVIARNAKGAYSCQFVIKLRDDDAPMLEWLHDTIGIGRLNRASVGRHNPALAWIVSDKRSCLYLTEIFDEFKLWSKKRRDYEIWREAVILWNASNGGPELRAEMARFHESIRAVREYKEAVA